MRKIVFLIGLILIFSAVFVYGQEKGIGAKNDDNKTDWVKKYEDAFNKGDVSGVFEAAQNIVKQKISDIAFERLLSIARNKNMTSEGEVDFRTMTIELIGKFKDERSLNELKNIAEDKEQLIGIRAYAIQQMKGASQDDKVFNYLVSKLKDPESQIRSIAAFNLGEPGNVKAGPSLMPLLNDEDVVVRNRAIRALGTIKYKEATEELIQKLMAKDKGQSLDEKVIKGVAAEALGQIGDDRAIDSLIAVLLDQSQERFVKIMLIKSLKNIKDDRVVNALIKTAREDNSVSYYAAEVLAALGDLRGADAIAEAIKHESDTYASKKLRRAYKALTGKDYVEQK